MFAVIYRFTLQPHQEESYIDAWNKIADYFIQCRGALGSSLHKGDDNLWLAYSRWPDKATRDASWSDGSVVNKDCPEEIHQAIAVVQKIKQENVGYPQYEEICLAVVEDKL